MAEKIKKGIAVAFLMFITIGTLPSGIQEHDNFIIGIGAISALLAVFILISKPKHNTEAENSPASVVSTQPAAEKTQQKELASSFPTVKTNIIHQEVPQKTINDMKTSYTGQQAVNDMRIIRESLDIIQKTSDIDTFLSRYDTAMRYILTLEQAKKAGVPIALPDGYSQSFTSVKGEALTRVLYRSFQKELNETNKLKTERGRLNRIEKYQEKLKGMYEDVFEFVAEDAYNDVMQKIESIING